MFVSTPYSGSLLLLPPLVPVDDVGMPVAAAIFSCMGSGAVGASMRTSCSSPCCDSNVAHVSSRRLAYLRLVRSLYFRRALRGRPGCSKQVRLFSRINGNVIPARSDKEVANALRAMSFASKVLPCEYICSPVVFRFSLCTTVVVYVAWVWNSLRCCLLEVPRLVWQLRRPTLSREGGHGRGRVSGTFGCGI